MSSNKVLTAEAAPESIPSDERLRLWVQSGGRCAVCNAYLLADEFTAQCYKFGEMAHNVGRKQSDKSPRGLHSLPVSERNNAANLLLLCETHHKLIDDKIKRAEYTVDDLKKMKREHEDRIKYLTGMGVDRRTTIIRAVGDIRGASVELSAEHVRKTVLRDANRYPDFPFAYRGQDLEIDFRNLPGEGTPEYWNAGKERLRISMDNQLREGVARGDVRHISVFAIARIPLLIQLGYMLDDKTPVDIYQKHRDGEEGWQWDQADNGVDFETATIQEGSNASKVALILNLSGTIQLHELPDQVDSDFTIFAIQPIAVAPNRNIIQSKESLLRFTARYHALLSQLEQTHKSARDIHLFPAIPVSVAVSCGRGLMREAHPRVIIYDRSPDGFQQTLTINDPEREPQS